MQIINLTQHKASVDQVSAGVVEIHGSFREQLLDALNFPCLPTSQEVAKHAESLAEIMKAYDPDLSGEVSFMVGGAPYLMSALVVHSPIYHMVFAYSERVSEEQIMPDGSCRKVNIFKHLGFIPMACNML